MRRIVVIILLVIIGAAIGGGIGVGVAIYFLQNRNVQQASTLPDTSGTTSMTTTEASEVVKQLMSEEGKQGSETAVIPSKTEETKEVKGDTFNVGQEVVPQEDTSDLSQQTVEIAQQDTSKGLKPSLINKAPQTSNVGSGINVPTIDLSSSIDLTTPNTKPRSTPTIPTVKPDINKSTPTFTISTLTESDIKKVYYQEGNLTKAERMLRKELKRNPKSTLAKKYLRLIKLERQAMALEAQGDSEGAKRIWQQILRIAPDHPRAKKRVQ